MLGETMAAQVKSTLNLILPQLQAALMAGLGFPVERVNFLSRSEFPSPFQADQMLYLQLYEEGVISEVTDGSGRTSTWVRRRVGVWCVNRLALDEANNDKLWTVDPGSGLVTMEDKVFDTMMCFHAVDGNQDFLTGEPVHYLGSSTPDKERKTMPLGWGASVMFFTVSYERACNQARM